VTLEALNIAFTQGALTMSAGRRFRIAFVNSDLSTPHGLRIRDGGGRLVFSGDIITGPARTTYLVQALDAGTYTFSCPVHMNMTGTLTVTP